MSSYEPYRIPPVFDLVALHQSCSRLHRLDWQDKVSCPCCGRSKSSRSLPFSMPTEAFIMMGQQIPLFFALLKGLTLSLTAWMFYLFGEFIFSSSITQNHFQVVVLDDYSISLTIGFTDNDELSDFLSFIFLAVLVFIFKVILKRNKYENKMLITDSSVSSRTLKLNNVPREATRQQIANMFIGMELVDIIPTYRIIDQNSCLERLRYLRRQQRKLKKRLRKDGAMEMIDREIFDEKIKLDQLNHDALEENNRMDIFFVTFENSIELWRAYDCHSSNWLMKLVRKAFPRFSKSVILAPDPEDIDWVNLSKNYYQVRIHRGICYFMCTAILIFSLGLSLSLSSADLGSGWIDAVVKTFVVLLSNMFTLNLLSYTTSEIESHETKTNRQLSLMTKMTFFLFINLSMSPLLVFLIENLEGNQKENLDNLCLSIALICLGNMLKPLMVCWNYSRIAQGLHLFLLKKDIITCEMTQVEANETFEPPEFPIAQFYALILSSLFMCSFFIGVFQLLIAVELLACCLLFIMAKWMLLRTCKEPLGLAKTMSLRAQRLLSFTVFWYWIGKKVMRCSIRQGTLEELWHDISEISAYNLIQIAVLAIYAVFMQKILSIVAIKLIDNEKFTESEIGLLNSNANRIDYRQANFSKNLLAEAANLEG